MALENLRIESFSDREFLLVISDHEQDGWTDSLDVAKALGFEDRRFAAQRFRWLAIYGAVEREHERDETGNLRYYRDGRVRHTQRWRLTELGRAMAYGKLRKGDETALGRIQDDQMLLVTRWLSDRSRGDSGVAKLVQREWRDGHAPRNGTGP
jgi:prophage antirepressor-like protein